MSYGFFNTTSYEKKNVDLSFNAKCGSCGLLKKCTTPKMKVAGKGRKGILLLFENPTQKQDFRGSMFTGKSMTYLKKCLKKYNIDMARDCYLFNAIQCRPDEKPMEKHVQACRPNVLKTIKKLKPKVIICFGTLAISSIISHRFSKGVGGINKWRGYIFPDFENNCWISSTFDINFARTHKQEVARLVFERDLKDAVSVINKELPPEIDYEKKVAVVTGTKDIIQLLKNTLKIKPTLFAFDYETTGLKPHAKGHEIVSCSFCYNEDKAYAFPMRDKKVRQLFAQILKCPDIHKIAANLKMEEAWSRVILDQKVISWVWDTMLASHCLDNRPGVNSLKFHALTRFGVFDYDSHLSRLLESDEDSGNGFNKIHQIELTDLLIYNGIDSYLEYMLAIWQMLMMGILDPIRYAKTRKVRTDINMFEANQAYMEKMERKQLLRMRTKNRIDIRRR